MAVPFTDGTLLDDDAERRRRAKIEESRRRGPEPPSPEELRLTRLAELEEEQAANLRALRRLRFRHG